MFKGANVPFAIVWMIFVLCFVSACDNDPPSTHDAGPDASDADTDSSDADLDSSDVGQDAMDSTPDADDVGPSECDYVIDLSPPAVFLSTFESGTTTPEVEDRGSVPLIDARDGGEMNAVANPHPDLCNPSAWVLEASSPPGYTRAEYQAPRLPTLDHAYIYTWREFIPEDFFTGIDLAWMLRSQWKTWPCGSSQPIDVADELCGGGGIFNEFEIDGHLGIFDFRTRPDCHRVQIPTHEFLGQWSTYVLEIYWTTSSDGYYRIFRNGRLLAQESGIKTLYDGFVEGECDISFATGLYDQWATVEGRDRDRIRAYFDDHAIFDMDDGVELDDVCPTCAAQTEIDTSSVCSFDDFLPIVDDELIVSSFDNSCDWNIGSLDHEERMEGETSLRWDHGFNGWLKLTTPDYESAIDLSHGDHLSFWVHNNIEEIGNSAVLLFYSDNDSTDGDDYYMVRIDFDFTGWRNIVVSRDEISSSRSPRGWDQIDRVYVRTTGWDCVRNPDRVLHLDEMKFTNSP